MLAADEAHLESQLKSASLELLTCKRIVFGPQAVVSKFYARVATRDLIQLFTQMEQLQAAGIPLRDALENMRDSTPNHRLRDILIEFYRDINEGMSLSEAMALHPDVFDRRIISLIAAGEQSGDLVATYRHLIAYLKWADEMKRRVRKAMRYPIVVLALVLIAVIVMMTYVVPQITQFFTFIGDGEPLPFATVALLATSAVFQQWWWLMIAIIIGAVAFVLLGRRISEEFAYKTDQALLHLPLSGVLIRKIEIARFVQTTSALYAAAIPFLDAIRIAGETVSNRVLAQALEEVHQDVIAGKPFSGALTATGEFPVMVPLMIHAAEETGKMSETLDQIAEFYNADVDEEVQKLIVMIEPALTVILGGMILWIALAVFGPIYSSFESIEI